MVYHYHLDHLGTPHEVTNDDGRVVWQASLKAWGALARTMVAEVAQPVRFQGQYHDAETGLHYNRFRYYAPDEGCYVHQDPIRLAGGTNVSAYAPNAVNWIDPFGLACSYEYNAVENPGPLAEMRGTPASNFAGGKYNASVLGEDTIFYRAGTADKPLGQWFTRAPPQSVAQVRIDSAVRPQWIDPSTGSLTGTSPIDTVHAINIPAGTTVYEGPVGYQGGPYLGGQDVNQTFISQPWNIDGVNVIGSGPLH